MRRHYKDGFVAGLLGAIILIVIMYAMQLLDLAGAPGFVGNYRAVFSEHPPADHIVAAVLFALSGGVWGLIYGAMVSHSTVFRGALFGFLPTLWLWLAVAPATGKPLFNGFALEGILLPILFDVVIWGSFVGWYCARSNRRP